MLKQHQVTKGQNDISFYLARAARAAFARSLALIERMK